MAIPYSRYVIGTLPWYGFLIVTGIVVAITLALREEKRLGLQTDTVIDLALWLIPFGLVGARLYYVIFQWDVFSQNPLHIFRIWEGGLAIYGGVLGGVIAIFIFAHRRRLSPALLTDMIVPGLALAQSIGRWGNYFNMEAYGRPIADSDWQFFPMGVQIPTGDGYVWHMATFFYESCWNFFVFIILWFVIRKRSKQAGITTLWYLLLYGTGRFFIEGLRMDSLMTSNIRISQLLSLFFVVISSVLLLIHAIKRKRTS